MRAADFGPEAGRITVREIKAGKPRHVALTDEGRAHLRAMTAGKTGREPIFVRDDGATWGASHQQRPLETARARRLNRGDTNILRHTYASSLATRGVPMGVIAAQLGHADTRMTERHYAYLAPVLNLANFRPLQIVVVEAADKVDFASMAETREQGTLFGMTQ